MRVSRYATRPGARLSEDADVVSESMGLRGQCGCCVSHLCGYIAASRDLETIASCLRIEYKVSDIVSLHLFLSLSLKHSAFGNFI